MKTNAALGRIAERLAAAGIEDARREARILLAAALGLDAAGLLRVVEVGENAAEAFVARRELREPLAYILGRREFWGMDFAVSPATLIPRPDSETVIEAALAAFPRRDSVRHVLDLGTGTGCLLLAALAEFPKAFGVGIDILPQAAALAAGNATAAGLAGRSAFIAGNWSASLNGLFDLILGNPPYIASSELPTLMPEVRDYEPPDALDGGADGLTAYRAIIANLARCLTPSGVAILELGIGQAQTVAELANMAGYTTQIRADLAGIPRALILEPRPL